MPVFSTLGALAQFRQISGGKYWIISFTGSEAPSEILNNDIHYDVNGNLLIMQGASLVGNARTASLVKIETNNISNLSYTDKITIGNAVSSPGSIFVDLGNTYQLTGNIFTVLDSNNTYVANVIVRPSNVAVQGTHGIFVDNANIFIAKSRSTPLPNAIEKFDSNYTYVSHVSIDGVGQLTSASYSNGNIIIGCVNANATSVEIADISTNLSNINYQRRISNITSLSQVEKNNNNYYFLGTQGANSFIGSISGNTINWSKQNFADPSIVPRSISVLNNLVYIGVAGVGNVFDPQYITCLDATTGNTLWTNTITITPPVGSNVATGITSATKATNDGLLCTFTLTDANIILPLGSIITKFPLNGAIPDAIAGSANYNIANFTLTVTSSGNSPLFTATTLTNANGNISLGNTATANSSNTTITVNTSPSWTYTSLEFD